MDQLPPLRPIAMRERRSILFLEYGRLDVLDGAFVLIDKAGVRVRIPVGGVACLMLEPGTRVSHAAIVLAARAGTLIVWVGEAGVRLYAAGQPGGARSDRLLYQAKLALDPDARLNVVRKMFEIRFGEPAPQRRSIEQLRGLPSPMAWEKGMPSWRGRQPMRVASTSGPLARTAGYPPTSMASVSFPFCLLSRTRTPMLAPMRHPQSPSSRHDVQSVGPGRSRKVFVAR